MTMRTVLQQRFAASALLLLLSHHHNTAAWAFVALSPPATTFSSSASAITQLQAIRCEESLLFSDALLKDKFYQLEEREDQECITTELFLRPDRIIDFGDTDGPIPIETSGYWNVPHGTDDFVMTITRKFTTGKEGTDMGEFNFETVREFKGEMTMVGESVAITGAMHNKDDLLGDEEVGFFNMIDGTKLRESYALEGRFSFEVDITKGNKLSEKFGSLDEQQQEMMQQQQPYQSATTAVRPNRDGVLLVLPPPLATALRMQDLDELIRAAETCFKSAEESDYYLKMCNEAQLWNNPTWPTRQQQQLELQQQQQPQQQQPQPNRVDPEKVLNSLPPAMSHAFRTQNMDRLTAALASMSKEDADYYMQQCIDAGLWQS